MVIRQVTVFGVLPMVLLAQTEPVREVSSPAIFGKVMPDFTTAPLFAPTATYGDVVCSTRYNCDAFDPRS